MVANPSRLAHAAGGDDHGAVADRVQEDRIVDVFRITQRKGQLARALGRVKLVRELVKRLEMAKRDRAGLGRERRVDEHERHPDASRLRQPIEQHEELLRAAERERRHDDVAVALMQHFVQDLDEFLFGIFHRAVIAIAVGRFDDQDVRMDDRIALADDQRRGLADVARNDQQALARTVAQADLRKSRADDVTGAAQPYLDVRMRPELDVVRHADQVRCEPIDIFRVVQRLFRGAPA